MTARPTRTSVADRAPPSVRGVRRSARGANAVVAAGCAAIALVLGWTVATLPSEATGLAPRVASRLEETGVSSPVTAVLLAFRGYDTLFEVMVLLVAALGVRAVTARVPPHPGHIRGAPVRALLRIIAPLGVLLAGYIVWRGSHGAGGAFQAGAILGGAGIALALGGVRVLRLAPPRLVLALWVLGPAVFLAAGIAGLLVTGVFLGVPAGRGQLVIAAIEWTVTLSIGIALVFLLGEGLPERAVERGTAGAASEAEGGRSGGEGQEHA